VSPLAESRDMKTILTTTLEIAYEESGPAHGRPVILIHGFPDDVHAYDGVAPRSPHPDGGSLFRICAATGRPDSSIRLLRAFRPTRSARARPSELNGWAQPPARHPRGL
jgi:pimeloyl-ACP methyl ester carboxylesterase